MKTSLLIALLMTSNVYAASNLACPAQAINWDSNGNSPYQIYAKCEGNLPEAVSGTILTIEARTSEMAGNGYGFAKFLCENGLWVIVKNDPASCAD